MTMEKKVFKQSLQRVGGFRQQKRKAVFAVHPMGESKAWICTRAPSLELIDFQGSIHRVVKLSFVTAVFGGVLNSKPIISDLSEVLQVECDDKMTTLAKFTECDIEGMHVTRDNIFVILKVYGSPMPGWRELLRLSETGDVLQCLNVNNQGDLLLQKPRLVSSFNDGSLCIVDRGSIKIMDKDGETILKESSLPREDDVWNISCDNFNNIILSCGLQGMVKIIHMDYSNKQKYNIKEILNEGIISVWSAVADDQDRLWISTFSGDVLVANYVE
jgi:hypothetical protein